MFAEFDASHNGVGLYVDLIKSVSSNNCVYFIILAWYYGIYGSCGFVDSLSLTGLDR